MLHDLTVHEAMPGHALQLMHSNRGRALARAPRVRERVVHRGLGRLRRGADGRLGATAPRSRERAAGGLRMQQLKMQLRSTLNTILDIRYHCGDLDEDEAMRLMTGRRVPGAQRGGGKVAPRPAHVHPAVHVLRRLPRDPRARPRRPHCASRLVVAAGARRDAVLRLAARAARAHAAATRLDRGIPGRTGPDRVRASRVRSGRRREHDARVPAGRRSRLPLSRDGRAGQRRRSRLHLPRRAVEPPHRTGRAAGATRRANDRGARGSAAPTRSPASTTCWPPGRTSGSTST